MSVRHLTALCAMLCVLAPSIARADTPAGPPADAPAQTLYVIQPGDQLQVLVFGGQGVAAIQVPVQPQPSTIASLSRSVIVLSDGTITYPLVGSVLVAGLGPVAAGQRIAAALAEYVRHPTVSVLIDKQVPPTIKVMGAVDHNGQIELQKGDRLADAIAKAGVNPYSYPDLNHITITRLVDGVGHIYNVNLYHLLLNADYSSNPELLPGDIVYVPKAKQVNLSNYANIPFALYYLYLLVTPGVNHSGGPVQ